MPGPPGELITREKKFFRERHQMSPTYGYMTKLFLESEFQHKENKQTKKKLIFSKILRFFFFFFFFVCFFVCFFLLEQIQKIKLFRYYTEKAKKYVDKIVIIRTGTYL